MTNRTKIRQKFILLIIVWDKRHKFKLLFIIPIPKAIDSAKQTYYSSTLKWQIDISDEVTFIDFMHKIMIFEKTAMVAR